MTGREVEYATELWLEGPSAFWLHPEGPLSETTPDEWRKKEAERVKPVDRQIAYMAAGMMNSGASLAAQTQSMPRIYSNAFSPYRGILQ